ncbi:hypothetical protein SteCoe_33073 [Stentor coeruleus]|uniref:Kelch motif family protein n=1 Tax=Stentor coeruleus TaxID=5963 RepID=A0A1R2AXK7_9CILI|nr:hypothetical protein SteCoe_33073 [Stentor coeruleus]
MGACTSKLDDSTVKKNNIINGLAETPNYRHNQVFKTTINLKDNQASLSKPKISTLKTQEKSLKSENKTNPPSSTENLEYFPNFYYFNRPTGQLFLITKSSTTEILLKSDFHFSQESAICYLSSKSLIFIGGVFKTATLNIVSLIDLSLQKSFLKAPLPFACKQGQAHEYKNWVYYIGGICQSENFQIQSPLMRYSLQQDLWQDLGRYGEHYKFNKIINMGTCIMGNKLLLIGGQRITSKNSLASNKKIFSINLENGFKVQIEGKMPNKLLKPNIAAGKKHGIITGGISLSKGTFNRKSYCIIIKNDICKIQTIENLSFDIKELYPGFYCGNYVMFISYPYVAVRMKNLKYWVEYQVTGKTSRLVMEICKDVENCESESSEESEKIENASKKSIVGFQHHKSLGDMKNNKGSLGTGERKSVPCKVQKGRKIKENDKMELFISRIKSQTDEESKFSASPELFEDKKRVVTEGDEDKSKEMEKNKFEDWPGIKMVGFEDKNKDEGDSFSEDFAEEIEVMMASDFIGSIDQDNPFSDDFPVVRTTDPQAIFSLMSSNFNIFDQSVESPILKVENSRKHHVKVSTFEITDPIKQKNDISDSEIIINPETSRNDNEFKRLIPQETKSDLKIPTNFLMKKDKTGQIMDIESPVDDSYKSSGKKSKTSDKSLESNKGHNVYSYKYKKNISSSKSSKSSNSDKNAYRFQNEPESLESSENSKDCSEMDKKNPNSLGDDKIATNDKTECQKNSPKIPKPMFKFTSKNTEPPIKTTISKNQEKPLLQHSNNETCQEIIFEIPTIQYKMPEKSFTPKISEEEIHKNNTENMKNKDEENLKMSIIIKEDNRGNIEKILEIETNDENQKIFESSDNFITPEISLKSKFLGKNKKKKSGSSSSSKSSNSSKPRNKKKVKSDFSNRKTPNSALIKADVLPIKAAKSPPRKLVSEKKTKMPVDLLIPYNKINILSPYFLDPIPSASKSSRSLKKSKNFQTVSYSSIVLNKTPQESMSNSSSYKKISQDYIKITPSLDKNLKSKPDTFKKYAKNEGNPTQTIKIDKNITDDYHENSVLPKNKSLEKMPLENFQSPLNYLMINENNPRKRLEHGQSSAIIEQKSDSKDQPKKIHQDIELISI